MTKTVTAAELAQTLDSLLAGVASNGDEVVITQGGVTVAKLVFLNGGTMHTSQSGEDETTFDDRGPLAGTVLFEDVSPIDVDRDAAK